ncbi:MocR-like pyridoxine biosynthesis transcription factor PdxR [Derxia lacustris]|uniref:MocR-like pyridoxine biosynthesis transcription factor PdxR n=1 Tax=Derxia lacustris TaxID=764842 RepID=UPI000A174B43|nr:PLP-dependent aminotransferase family protein [Derxia lacustris]
MELQVVIEGDSDQTGQLYRQLKDAISTGHLAAGQRLPPSRQLATQLGLSRKIVAEAYARLTYDRLVVGRIGSGTYVSEHGRRQPLAQPPPAQAVGRPGLERWRGLPSAPRRSAPSPPQPPRFELLPGRPDRLLFPHDEWRRCVLWGLRQSARLGAGYGDPRGLPMLREAIARHVAFARGVRCSADDIVVTSGAQQAMDLVARVTVEPGSAAAVEEPGYGPARLLLAGMGARVQGVPVDREGMLVEQIAADTRLVHVTPTHQYPLGMQMSPRRRMALLARARELGAIVMEDDYDSELPHAGRPANALQSIDDHGSVAFVGSFSKTLAPDLRLGYVVAPPAILDAVIHAKQLSDWHTATPMQWALARFIDNGELLRHIKRSQQTYATRRERLALRIDTALGHWLERVPSVAGLHLSAMFRGPVDTRRLVAQAWRAGVGLDALDGCYRDSPPRSGLMFGLGSIELADIDAAVELLRLTLTQLHP